MSSRVLIGPKDNPKRRALIEEDGYLYVLSQCCLAKISVAKLCESCNERDQESYWSCKVDIKGAAQEIKAGADVRWGEWLNGWFGIENGEMTFNE
jgi:hypothetical protein